MIQYYDGTPRCDDAMWRQECESILPYCQGRGLDVGAGQRTLRPDVVRIDMNAANAPHHVADAMRLPFGDGEFDFAIGVHVLEHFDDPRAALAEQLRVVRVGGHVCHVIPWTLYTQGSNTDPTPHRHEYNPRDFLEEVLDFRDRSVDWFNARPELSNGRVVSYGVACLRWSFHVAIERTC